MLMDYTNNQGVRIIKNDDGNEIEAVLPIEKYLELQKAEKAYKALKGEMKHGDKRAKEKPATKNNMDRRKEIENLFALRDKLTVKIAEKVDINNMRDDIYNDIF